jgi:hypothetical protein
VSGSKARSVILDHCSLSWATDEVLGVWQGVENVTIQSSIIAEGLHKSVHPKGPHSKGALVGGGATNVTFYRNLFAHNLDRNPWVKADEGTASRNATGTTALFQVVNNVIYNGADGIRVGAAAGALWAPFPGKTVANVVGNYYKPGPVTDKRWHEILVGRKTSIYVKGNLGTWRTNNTMDSWASVGLNWNDADKKAAPGTAAPASLYRASSPFPAPALPESTAVDAYAQLLQNVGAMKPVQDAVDARIIANVRSGSGGTVIDNPSQVGGWPMLRGGVAPVDLDNDGMSDSWERLNRLNPADPADRNGDLDGDGYTNLEEYLNELA